MADNEQIRDEQDYIITMYNVAADRDEEFYHLATIEYKEKHYAVLQPVEALDDIPEDEVLIYEISEIDDENAELVPIEDEKLLQTVFDKFIEEYSLEDIDENCNCGSCGCGCDSDSDEKSCCDNDGKGKGGCCCNH